MRKFINTVIAFAAALTTLSCADDIQNKLLVNEEESTGEKTTVEFALDLGELPETRALTENAQVKNIYICVFDASGYKLSEYVEAEPNTKAGDNDGLYHYTAELTITDDARILHIIANAPESLTYGSENTVIGSLYTSIDATDNAESFSFKEAYWARLELDCIPKKPVTGETDYSAKLTKYNDIVKELSSVKLIRNYSKVTAQVKSSVTNFTLDGFWFVNYPDRGTVAPYNRNTGTFMTDYLNYTSAKAMESETYKINEGTAEEETLDGGNYQGFMLATTKFLTPETFVETAAGGYCKLGELETGKAVGYVYEREKALSSPMYLIIKGKYDSNENGSLEDESFCYYKIAMQDGNGSFYAMLRNFNYLIEIQSVSRKGESTAAAALLAAPSGDISVNVDLQDLTNISDGKARMTVSATTVMLVGTVGESISGYTDFWYRYEPDIEEHPGTVYNGTSTDNASYYVTIDDSNYGESGTVFSSVARQSTDDGANRKLTLSTNKISAQPKHQTLVIKGHKINGSKDETITRTVEFYLRPYLTMSLKCGPISDASGNGYIKEKLGEPVDLTIGFEGGLPASIFPLEFNIEAENLTLTPDNDDLPVRTGISTIDGKSSSAFWFVKSISWDEYQAAPTDPETGEKYFTCKLKANTKVSATDIYVSQTYFAQNHKSLYNYTPATFTSTSFSSAVLKTGTSTTFSFTMSAHPTDDKVMVALDGYDPVSGLTYAGNTTIDGKEYELYEYSIASGTNGSFQIKPFKSGTVSIVLDAYKFERKTINKMASLGSYAVYVDASRTNDDADDMISNLSYDYTGGKYAPVIGQTCTLTVYVANGGTGTVKIGGNAATKKTGSKIIDGTTYYAYYVNNYTELTAGIKQLPVIVGTETQMYIDVPIYGLNVRTDQEVSGTTLSFNTSGYYAIKSFANNKYLRNVDVDDNLAANDSFNYLCMWKFSNTASPSMISSTGTGTTRNIRMSSSNQLKFGNNDNRADWNIEYGDKGCRIYRGSTYYLYDNSGTIALSNSDPTNDNKYWHIYPVEIVAPTE